MLQALGEVLIMTDELLYHERLASNRTEALFVALTVLFSSLCAWRQKSRGLDKLAFLFLGLSGLFAFYSLNYRTLIIRLTSKSLALTFGLFTWTVPLENIADCRLDEVPPLQRMGGAGIHFMMVHNRYRASFNFLEYPRVVCAFSNKMGPVQDLSFSTRRPDDVLRLLLAAVSASQAAADGHPAGLHSTPPPLSS